MTPRALINGMLDQEDSGLPLEARLYKGDKEVTSFSLVVAKDAPPGIFAVELLLSTEEEGN